MRTLSIVAASALLLLAPRPAAAEFVSYGPAHTDGYGVTFSVGEPYCPDSYPGGSYPAMVPAPVYVPVPVVVYPPPPPPVVVYPYSIIYYRSVIVHRPFVEKRVIGREIVRKPFVVNRHVVVREREAVHRGHSHPSGHRGFGFSPALGGIQHRH